MKLSHTGKAAEVLLTIFQKVAQNIGKSGKVQACEVI